MCFGNDDAPQPPQYVAPPPQQEILDVIDEITGTQTITVTGPNGKKIRKTERLPRTAEEQERYALGENLIKRSIDNIIALRSYDPNAVINFEPIIRTFADLNRERIHDLGQVANFGNIQQDVQAFRDMQTQLDDELFTRERRSLEENLAHRGVSDSYAGQEARAFAARNENLYRKESEFKANLYGEDLARRRLDRNREAFGLREIGRQGRLAEAQADYQLRRDQVSDLDRRRERAIGENMNLLGIGSNLVGTDLNKALGNQTAQLANQTFQMQNADSLNRYTAGVNAQNAAYDRARHAYDNRPPSFMDFALQAGGTAIGSAFGMPQLGAAAGSMAGKMMY